MSAAAAPNARALCLGFDFSTQSLTTIVLERNDVMKKPIYFSQLHYDEHFPEFQTKQGVIRGENERVWAPVLLFARALERALGDIPLEVAREITHISGSAQQHCSVYWKCPTYANLDMDLDFTEQLCARLANEDMPSWMDNSTSALCAKLEATFPGGAIRDISGSRAFERFTGVQIIGQLNRFGHRDGGAVKRVTLLSNALTSVLCGRFVAVDTSDASGMNLMNVRTGKWSDSLCRAHEDLLTTPFPRGALLNLLGMEPVPTHAAPLVSVDKYFVNKFGLHPDCKVMPFTGDNPSTVVGLNLRQGDCAISLGTSTTVLRIVKDFDGMDLESHVMQNPLEADSFMEMFCFKNGALVRDEFISRNNHNNQKNEDWQQEFEALVREGVRLARDEHIAFVYPQVESTPRLKRTGVICFDRLGARVDFASLPRALALVALLHGQFLAIVSRVVRPPRAAATQHHQANTPLLGLGKILVTGGGANSRAMVQLLANCFQREVSVCATAQHAACLGAAYRAAAAEKVAPPVLYTISPELDARYDRLLKRYVELEEVVKQELG